MTIAKLFHSAAAKPGLIGDHPYFDSFMFFSGEFQRARGEKVFTIEIDAADLIDVESVFSYEENGNMREFVEEAKALIKQQYGVEIDDELAEDIIAQRVEHYDHELATRAAGDRDDFDSYADWQFAIECEQMSGDWEIEAETDWKLQVLGAKCARAAGFRGVELTDEMGRTSCVCMRGRETDLVECVGEDA